MPHIYLKSSADVRDKVIAAALSLFTGKGFFNTSMRDITRESSVSTGSIYHHFKDKEGVAAALYQRLIELMEEQLGGIMRTHVSAHDQCRAVVALLFDITETEPDMMTFMLYTKHREFLPSQRPVCSSKPFETLRSMVERGMQRGEIVQGDLLAVSSCLFGGPIHMITSKLDGMLDKPLQSYLDEVWSCAWRGVSTA